MPPLFGPNDGPLYQLEEDVWPLGRKRDVRPITDSADREWNYLRGEGPSAPEARSLALPRRPDPGRPGKLGWVVRGKPGAPESAHVREARVREGGEASARARHDFIADNRDRTGVHPITGEVLDERKAARTARALVRGPRSLPQRPPERVAEEAARSLACETRRAVRGDALLREGLEEAPPERPSAADNFLPREHLRLARMNEGIFAANRDFEHAGADTESGIGPGMVPTAERAGDGIFHPDPASRNVDPNAGADTKSDLGSDLVPKTASPVGFLHGAANYDYRRSGFRNGGGWR